MNDIVDNVIVNFLKELSVLIVALLVNFVLTSYVIALAPLVVLQVASSNQPDLLANLTITKFAYISSGTITFFNNVIFRIDSIFALLASIFFMLLDIQCYLKVKKSKNSLNY